MISYEVKRKLALFSSNFICLRGNPFSINISSAKRKKVTSRLRAMKAYENSALRYERGQFSCVL